MNLVFVGTGYVGLVSGVLLSHIGHKVTCIDTDKDKINKLKLGILPLYEIGLQTYLNEGMKNNQLDFVYGFEHSFVDAEAVFITVGTPSLSSGDTDLSSIFISVKQILPKISPDCVIIIKSTVPPGTTARISEYIHKIGYKNQVASNPEFLREGVAVKDFLEPERIVIGSDDENTKNLLQKIYRYLIDHNVTIVNTDPTTAELIKYASNAFLATKIAFINEMSDLCEYAGGDIEKLALGIGLDSRIGDKFLKAGPGFGGSCFPKDILGLAYFAEKINKPSLLVQAVINTNIKRYSDMAEKIAKVYDDNLKDVNLAILGVTYKAGTDDVRNSPAIEIIKLLQKKGANLTVYDPQGIKSAIRVLNGITYADSTINLWTKKDGIVILTEWPEFTFLDFEFIKSRLIKPIIIDLRNILDPIKLKNIGYKYVSVGRKDA